MANYKIYIKDYLYKSYKISKNHNFTNWLKIQKCDIYTYKKIIY